MVTISTNKDLLDVDFIFQFLSQSYWAGERPLEVIEEIIENSLCFGLYLDGKQIGFARILTDKRVFSYLADVLIDEKYQRMSYGKELLDFIYNHDDLKFVKKNYLLTKDAQAFYAKFGFEEYPTPSRFMIRSK